MVKIPAASLLYVAYQTLAPQAPWMVEFAAPIKILEN